MATVGLWRKHHLGYDQTLADGGPLVGLIDGAGENRGALQ
jgi:hypothetical protein